MAISKRSVTFGLLDVWREVMWEDPWLFNQITGAGVRERACPAYLQDAREQLARALFRAFNDLESGLGYPIVPYWTYDDIPLGDGVPYQMQQLRTSRGMVQAYGQKAVALVQAGVAVTYSDSDSDGINDTATVQVATALAAAELVGIFQVADGATTAGDEQYRIEPLYATSAGGVVTLTGHRALFVKPNTIWDIPYKITDPNRRDLHTADTQTAADFVTHVDVYRIYNDASVPAVFYSDPFYWQTSSLDQWNTDTGVVLPVNNRLGIFKVRPPASCAASCSYAPEQVRVFYQAGLPLVNQHVDYEFGEACVRLANCRHSLNLPDALCERTRALFEEDCKPMPAELLGPNDVKNPFGLKQGQVQAWRLVEDRALGQGGK